MVTALRISLLLLVLASTGSKIFAQSEIKSMDSLVQGIITQSVTGPYARPRLLLSGRIKEAVRLRNRPVLEHLGTLLKQEVWISRYFVMGQDFSCEKLLLFGEESCDENTAKLITDSTIYFRTQLAYVITTSIIHALVQDKDLPQNVRIPLWYDLKELPRSESSGFFEERVIVTRDKDIEFTERILLELTGVRLTFPLGTMEESTLYVLDVGREGCLTGRWH